MTLVKICGLMEVEDAVVAAEGGADLIGLIFAPSPRQVTPERAKDIVAAIKRFPPRPKDGAPWEGAGGVLARFIEGTGLNKRRPATVGVFVNTPPSLVNQIANFCSLDAVQLSGDETWPYCRKIHRPVIKTVHVKPGDSSAQEVLSCLQEGASLMPPGGWIWHLDTGGTLYGGSGKTFDWTLARQAAREWPVLLAGGLNPENVAQAVEEVAPWGVDVSGGVERQGKKDPERILAFIGAVRAKDRAMGGVQKASVGGGEP
ncbi:MAG: phosphoribosylanthranilate isomerase [Chloroflexi bacterium]|nr:phosphoribosylanthranilate isomerase [Chloroflexota bacterium]